MMRLEPFARVLLTGMLMISAPLLADEGSLVVVTNAGAGIETLTRDQVINIFLGRFRQFPSGVTAIPIDQPDADPIKADFYQRLVNKNSAEIRSYWSRLVFSGKTAPPRPAASEQEVIEALLHEPGAIGYLNEERLQSPLKIVFTLAP